MFKVEEIMKPGVLKFGLDGNVRDGSQNPDPFPGVNFLKIVGIFQVPILPLPPSPSPFPLPSPPPPPKKEHDITHNSTQDFKVQK